MSNSADSSRQNSGSNGQFARPPSPHPYDAAMSTLRNSSPTSINNFGNSNGLPTMNGAPVPTLGQFVPSMTGGAMPNSQFGMGNPSTLYQRQGLPYDSMPFPPLDVHSLSNTFPGSSQVLGGPTNLPANAMQRAPSTSQNAKPLKQPSKKRKASDKAANISTNGQAEGLVGSPLEFDDGASGDEASGKSKRDKRIKTPRACDSCRRKKIRCDVIEEDPPLCKHCKAHNFDCTWFLPITETRWKKTGKPPTQSQKAAGLGNTQHSPSTPASIDSPMPSAPVPFPPYRSEPAPLSRSPVEQTPFSQSPDFYRMPGPSNSATANLNANSRRASPTTNMLPAIDTTRAPQPALTGPAPYALPSPSQPVTSLAMSSVGLPAPTGHRSPDPRVLGVTSISYLMHSTSTLPPDRFSYFNARYTQTWDTKETGDGFIKIFQNSHNSSAQNLQQPGGPAVPINYSNDVLPAITTAVSAATMEQLVNMYLNTHASLFPILSRADFLASAPLEPLLLWTMCGVAAMTVKVPVDIFRSIKTTVALVGRETDVLASSSLQTVQALLIFSMSLHLERGPPGTKCWNSVAMAIRQAQDLGLHREADTPAEKQIDPHHVELRRRIWGGCIIADRWISAIYGNPMMIDIADCDRLYPSVFEYLPGQPADSVDMSVKPFLGNASFIELSILLGQVLKLLYTPSGINGVSDEQLFHMKGQLDAWLAELPEELQFSHPATCTPMCGFLHMAYVTVRFLAFRPFLKVSYRTDNVTFHVTMADWKDISDRAQMSIEWLDGNDYVFEGWGIALYSTFISSLIQYHNYVRTADETSIYYLRKARDMAKRLASEDMSGRSKVAEIVTILEHTAVSLGTANAQRDNRNGANGATRVRVMNPTHGVESVNVDGSEPRRTTAAEFEQALRQRADEDAMRRRNSTDGFLHPRLAAKPDLPRRQSLGSIPESLRTDIAISPGPSNADIAIPSDDPNAMFTFAPGMDLPSSGPLGFDSFLPTFGNDQKDQWGRCSAL